MVLRSVILGYSTSGFSFMHHTVITLQLGFTWFTNLDAVVLGVVCLAIGSFADGNYVRSQKLYALIFQRYSDKIL